MPQQDINGLFTLNRQFVIIIMPFGMPYNFLRQNLYDFTTITYNAKEYFEAMSPYRSFKTCSI